MAGVLKNATAIVTSQTGDEKSIKAADGSWSGAFQGSKLESIDLTGLNISGVTDVSSMFANDTHLKSVKGLQTWDTSKVENFNNLFNGDSSLTGTVDISNWDLTSLKATGKQEERADSHIAGAGLDNLFQGTQVSEIKAANWDFTGNPLVTQHMPANYSDSYGLNVKPFAELAHLQSLDISNWKLPTVTDTKNASLSITYLAMDCPELTTVDMSGWQGNALGKMAATFSNDPKLSEIKGIEDFNVSNVWDLSDTFQNTGLMNLDLHKWDVRNVRTFVHMLDSTSKLQTLNLSGWKLYDQSKWRYPSRPTSRDNIHSMLANSGVTSIDVSNWDFGENDYDLGQLFSGLKNLKTINVSGWNSPKVSSVADLFSYDPELTTITGLADVDTGSATNMSGIFQHDLKLASVDGIQNWDTSSATTMDGMFNFMANFYNPADPCALTNIPDLSSWNTAKVTSMVNMFSGLNNPSLTTIKGIENWDTSSLTKTNQMFARSSSLTNVDLTKWQMDKVTTTNSMFYGADHLTSVGDLTNWNLANDGDTVYMFNGTTALTKIGSETEPWKWGISTKNTNAGQMFQQSGIEYVDARNWDLSNSNAAMMFWNSGIRKVDARNMKLGKASTNRMFAALEQPAVIDLRGAQGTFKMDAFDGLGKIISANPAYSRPLVVLSDDPTVQALNDSQYKYTKDSKQTFTGRSDSNYLTFSWAAEKGGQPTPITIYSIDDQHPGTFVFKNPDSVWSAFRTATSKEHITKLLGNQADQWNYLADIDSTTDTLKNVDPQTTLPELVSYVVNLTKKGAPTTVADSKTVTQTIHYRYADGTTAHPDVVKTVTLTRTGTKDAMTGVVTWGAWSIGEFPAVTSPVIDGYTADKLVVAASPAIGDQEVTVTYTKNKSPLVTITDNRKVTQTIHYRYADGTIARPDVVKTVTLTRTGTQNTETGEVTWGAWSTGEFPAVTSPVIDDYTADKLVVAASPATGDQEVTVTYTKNKETKPNNPSTPTTPTFPDNSGKTRDQTSQGNPLANKSIQQKGSNQQDHQLPQTGNHDENIGILGLAVAGFAGMLGIVAKKRD